jgi:hypothetical protein
MQWVKNLWSACTTVVGTGIDYAANFLNKLGSLSSMVGGAGLAVASVVEEEVNVAYYGSAYVPGKLHIDISVPQLKIKINETIPYSHTWSKQGEMLYDSKNYLTPQAIGMVSAMLVISGTLVQVVAANIKIKRRYIEDRKVLVVEENIGDFAPPSKDEYKYAMAEAACRSVTHASLSYAIVGSILSFSYLNQFSEYFTYPTKGQPAADGSSYIGPVMSELIPVSIEVQENITVTLPDFDIQLLIEQTANAEAVANVSYGGGLFFKAKNKVQPVVVAPALLALGTHAAGNFFERKAIRARDARIAETHASEYRLLPRVTSA